MKSNPRTATMVSIVTVLASLSLAGCGSDEGGRKADPGQTGAIEPFTSVASASDASVPPAVQPVRTNESVPADSLPPDVVASAQDSVATPGATVEVEARASADAVEVFLWDGIGRKQSFSYDSTANVWRGRYRVPLGAPGGRLGLAVTAKNGLDLRNRVWVFLRIDRQASAETERQPEAAPATTTGQ
jgi:hypothetical protein